MLCVWELGEHRTAEEFRQRMALWLRRTCQWPYANGCYVNGQNPTSQVRQAGSSKCLPRLADSKHMHAFVLLR